MQRLLNLLPEGAPLGQTGDTTSRLAKHRVAASAEHDRLRMTVDRRDLQAAGALDVHEVAVRALNQALQLVLALLVGGVRVQEVNIHGYGFARTLSTARDELGLRSRGRG